MKNALHLLIFTMMMSATHVMSSGQTLLASPRSALYALPASRLAQSLPPAHDADYPVVEPIDPRRFPPNPLGILSPDPLLKDPKQVLSDLEKDQLRSALDELHQMGQQQFSEKQPDAAFLTWFRELRLRQALGFREEIFALAKVGETAWQNNRTRDLRDITERLQAIQAKIQPPTSGQNAPQSNPPQFNSSQSNPPQFNPPLSLALDDLTTSELQDYLALAYQVVRSPQLALSIYEPRLQKLRTESTTLSAIEAFKTLNAIGQVHLDWFRYGKAQRTYQDLRDLSRLAQDRTSEALYLIQLTHIAEQRHQPQDAIGPLQDLIQLYSTQPEVQPALYLRLAQNYSAAKDWLNAERSYQTTFTLSQPLSQNSYGSTALFELATLYQRTDRLAAAEQVYDYLVDAEQAVYNLHNAMKAADFLGQMRDRQQNYVGAITAYEQSKALAQRLSIQPEQMQLLQSRLDKTRQKIASPTPSSPIAPGLTSPKPVEQ